MKNEFVTYEQALVLKELGFDEPCLFHTLKGEIDFYRTSQDYFFKNTKNSIGISAILYQQAFRWFREKYSLIVYPVWRIDNTWDMNIQKLDNYGLLSGQSTLVIIKKPNYEEAEQACLSKLIEIVNDKRRNS
jgi:hypothetical protein